MEEFVFVSLILNKVFVKSFMMMKNVRKNSHFKF